MVVPVLSQTIIKFHELAELNNDIMNPPVLSQNILAIEYVPPNYDK